MIAAESKQDLIVVPFEDFKICGRLLCLVCIRRFPLVSIAQNIFSAGYLLESQKACDLDQQIAGALW